MIGSHFVVAKLEYQENETLKRVTFLNILKNQSVVFGRAWPHRQFTALASCWFLSKIKTKNNWPLFAIHCFVSQTTTKIIKRFLFFLWHGPSHVLMSLFSQYSTSNKVYPVSRASKQYIYFFFIRYLTRNAGSTSTESLFPGLLNNIYYVLVIFIYNTVLGSNIL